MTTIDFDKLTKGLNALTGYDYEAAEKQARALGDTSAEIGLSKTFQAILAAKALGVKPDDLKALPIKDYAQAMAQVFGFLFGASDA